MFDMIRAHESVPAPIQGASRRTAAHWRMGPRACRCAPAPWADSVGLSDPMLCDTARRPILAVSIRKKIWESLSTTQVSNTRNVGLFEQAFEAFEGVDEVLGFVFDVIAEQAFELHLDVGFDLGMRQ